MPTEVHRLISLTAATAPTDLLSTSARDASEYTAVHRPVTPTCDLLQLVDGLCAVYADMVGLSATSLQLSHPSTAVSRGTGRASTAQEEERAEVRAGKEAAMAQHVARMERCVVELQQGIRSKTQQTGRLALLLYLRQEVAERSSAVAKMEAALHVVRQTARPPVGSLSQAQAMERL